MSCCKCCKCSTRVQGNTIALRPLPEDSDEYKALEDRIKALFNSGDAGLALVDKDTGEELVSLLLVGLHTERQPRMCASSLVSIRLEVRGA